MSTTTIFACRDSAAAAVEISAAAAKAASQIRQIAECVGGRIAGYVMRRAQCRLERLARRHLHALPDRPPNNIGISRSGIDYVVTSGCQGGN